MMINNFASKPYNNKLLMKNYNTKKPEFYEALSLNNGLIWRQSDCDCRIYQPFSPFSFFPFEIKRSNFQYLSSLQKIWNKLLVKMSMDQVFLNELHKSTKQTSIMIENLLKIANKVFNDPKVQKTCVFISRSDYMMDNIKKTPLQVEVNLMSVGGWTLSDKIQKISKVIATNFQLQGQIVQEKCTQHILFNFQRVYSYYNSTENPQKKTVFLMISKGDDSDYYEQIQIQTQLLYKGVKVIKYSFAQLVDLLTFDQESHKIYVNSYQIAVVYYRQGIFQNDCKNQDEYLVRERLQLSRAIKIPNVCIQLLNYKNFQICINTTDILSKYLDKNQVALILKSQTKFWTAQEINQRKEQIIAQYKNKLVVKSILQGEKVYLKEEAEQYLRTCDPHSIILMEYIDATTEKYKMSFKKNFQKTICSPEIKFFAICQYNHRQVTKNEYVGSVVESYLDTTHNDSHNQCLALIE